jgi:hypothetical protein
MDAITTRNIEDFRGALTLKPGDLPYELWKVFDRLAYESAENPRIVPVQNLVSPKNQLLDPKFISGKKADPRQTAFNFMSSAALGLNDKRPPLKVYVGDQASFQILDGNATAQVLMLVGWSEVPVEIVDVVEQCRFV